MIFLPPKSKLHFLKNLYRRYRYGAGCCDIFTFYEYLKPKILPGLKEFRKHTNGWPNGVKDMDEWYAILDKIIWAFEYEETFDLPYDIEKDLADSRRQQEGFELFGKHFRSLWI